MKDTCSLCNGKGKLLEDTKFAVLFCPGCNGKGYVEHANNTVDDRERRHDLRCPHCRPNRGENAKRRPKHGKTKARKKDKR